MKRRGLVLFPATAAIALSADLLTKWWVELAFVGRTAPAVVIPGFLQIFPTHNPGAVGGLFSGRRSLLIAVTVVAMAIIVGMVVRGRERGRWWVTALGLLFGGAAGNLYDRLRFGYVRDFVDVHFGEGGWHYPTFNVADAALVAGAIMMVIFMWRHREKPAREPER